MNEAEKEKKEEKEVASTGWLGRIQQAKKRRRRYFRYFFFDKKCVPLHDSRQHLVRTYVFVGKAKLVFFYES